MIDKMKNNRKISTLRDLMKNENKIKSEYKLNKK